MKFRSLSLSSLIAIVWLSIVASQKPTDTWAVYYLEAPLLKNQYGNMLADFDLYHAGLGFSNMENDESYTVQFYAVDGVLRAVFPIEISTWENQALIVWANKALVNLSSGIDTTYWTNQQIVYYINQTTWEQFKCWIPTYESTNNVYQLFQVMPITNDTLYMPSSNCADFVWAAFQALYDLGATVDPETVHPPRDFATFYTSSPPDKVDFQVAQHDIVEFYEKWQWNSSISPNETAQALISKVISLTHGKFYYYYEGEYYLLTLVSPYAGFEYVDVVEYTGLPNPSKVTLDKSCLRAEEGQHYGLSGGSIFLIIFFSCLTAYCVVGVFVQSKRGATGIERIPNHSLWSSVLTAAKDGVRYTWMRINYAFALITGRNQPYRGYQYDQL